MDTGNHDDDGDQLEIVKSLALYHTCTGKNLYPGNPPSAAVCLLQSVLSFAPLRSWRIDMGFTLKACCTAKLIFSRLNAGYHDIGSLRHDKLQPKTASLLRLKASYMRLNVSSAHKAKCIYWHIRIWSRKRKSYKHSSSQLSCPSDIHVSISTTVLDSPERFDHFFNAIVRAVNHILRLASRYLFRDKHYPSFIFLVFFVHTDIISSASEIWTEQTRQLPIVTVRWSVKETYLIWETKDAAQV